MKRITIFLVLGYCTVVAAQKIPNWSMYMLNQYTVNPAYVGSTDQLHVAAGFHKLLATIPESPFNQYVNAHMEVANNMGAGINFFHQSEKTVGRTGFTATYAYHISLGDGGQRLAFGLSGGLSQFKNEVTSLDPKDTDDPLLQGDISKMVPEVNFGTYYYSDEDNYYIGFAARQLVQTKIYEDSDEPGFVRHYYLYGGYNYEINQDWSIEPAAMFRLTRLSDFSADISIIGRYKEMVMAGLLYRPRSNTALLLGFTYEQFSLGYSYMYGIGSLGPASMGSHEIMLMYRFSNFIRK